MDPTQFAITDTARSMQRIMLLVSRGMTRWTGGTITLEKAPKLVAKFDDKYGVLANRADQKRARRRGIARARLSMGIVGPQDSGQLWWLLLVSSDGGGPVTELEVLHDAGDKRRRIMVMNYELVRYPKSGGSPTWTWRMPAGLYRQHKSELVALARHRSPNMAQEAIRVEMTRPGFRGLREQRNELFRAMTTARQPLVDNGAEPLIMARIPYLRILSHEDETVTLQALWEATVSKVR